MYSQSQSYHSTGHYLEHGQRPIGKVGVSRRVFLYPTMNRGQTHSNVADKAHEEYLFAQGRPHYVKSECPVLPPYEPLRRPPCKFPMPMVPPQHQVLLSPPVVHRVTSSAPPFLRYEQIGDPTLRIFKLRLPRNLLSRLDGIIAHSERYAEGLAAGWKTELYSLTRQDLALRDIPGMTPRIRPIFEYITHAIQVLYGCQKVVVDKNQPHILKYSIDTGHTGVQLHHDRCDITANLVLSQSDEYEGGGTYFPDAGGMLVRLEQGEFMLHPGSLVHGGLDIRKGTRFLMVLFAHLK